jgi:hypothetical protein
VANDGWLELFMSQTISINLFNRQQAWKALQGQIYPFLKEALQTGKRWILTIKPETRTQAQNRLMWPILTEFSRQLEWPVNGRMVRMEPEEWKDVLTAAFRSENVRLAMGLNGGVVMLGQRTSKFTKAEFAEWIEFLYATAAEREVELPEWSDVNDDQG